METKNITKVGMAALIAMLESATCAEDITHALESSTMCEIAKRDIAEVRNSMNIKIA